MRISNQNVDTVKMTNKNSTERMNQGVDIGNGKEALEAASFVIFGFGLSQAIRLGGNIILTRLLVPEIFGIITLARVFYMGLGLFSDVGLEPAIIRSKRSYDPSFLNTAWTIQIIRSVILAALSAVIAYPVSLFYQEPSLIFIIPLIGFVSIPDGCRSTSLSLLNKELQQKKLTTMEIGIQTVSLVVMTTLAYFLRNIFALIIGEFIGTCLRMIWSHYINTSLPNRFTIDKEAVKELLNFGKWILLSTAMMFLATQADRFILGKLFTMSMLGIYSIALNFAELPKQILGRLNGKVIYPLIVKYAYLSNTALRDKMKNPRRRLLFIVALLLACLGSFGDVVIHLLYDQRYQAAAWILPMLAFGMWPLILLSTIESSLLAIGKPKYAAAGNLFKFVYMVTVLPLSFRVAGEFGAVLSIALNDIPSYVVINIGLKKERLSLLKQDLFLTIVLLFATMILISIRMFMGVWVPGVHRAF